MRRYADEKKGQAGGWVMQCDTCGYRSDVRPTQNDLPLDEFRAAEWLVAKKYGDKCPTCAQVFRDAAEQYGFVLVPADEPDWRAYGDHAWKCVGIALSALEAITDAPTTARYDIARDAVAKVRAEAESVKEYRR